MVIGRRGKRGSLFYLLISSLYLSFLPLLFLPPSSRLTSFPKLGKGLLASRSLQAAIKKAIGTDKMGLSRDVYRTVIGTEVVMKSENVVKKEDQVHVLAPNFSDRLQ